MSISELFLYRNDSFQCDIFSSNIGIPDVGVRCRILPTLRSMSMPTYEFQSAIFCQVKENYTYTTVSAVSILKLKLKVKNRNREEFFYIRNLYR
jgi:hypothetical protein